VVVARLVAHGGTHSDGTRCVCARQRTSSAKLLALGGVGVMATLACQERWRHIGAWVAGLTLEILIVGFVAHVVDVAAQWNEMTQAATNATLTAQISALTERIAKLESQNNYVLLAIVGALITQLVQLKAATRK